MRVSSYIQSLKLLQLRSHRFALELEPPRQWEIDISLPEIKFGIECQGGLWLKKGRHKEGKGLEDWIDKHADALKLGWTLYYCDLRLIKSGRAIQRIELLIKMLLDPKISFLTVN